MKPISEVFPCILLHCLCLALCLLSAVPKVQGQDLIEGNVMTINYLDSKTQFFKIPATTTASFLYLRAEGADGGKRFNDELNINYAAGGEGATIKAHFRIGDGDDQIPAGSDVAVIIGHEGASRKTVHMNGAGGGGGTYTKDGLATNRGHGGGSGGSYVNEDLAAIGTIVKIKNGSTYSPDRGFVEYQLTNSRMIRLAAASSKCIGVQGDGTAAGASIQLWDCKNTAAQHWFLDGFDVKYRKDAGKCLDLNSSKTANGTNIQLWDCNGTGAQHWIYDVATQSIRSSLDFNKCLDLDHSNTANGANIQLYSCNGTGAQKWLVDGLPSTMPAGGNHKIRLIADTDKCVDVKNGHTTNGTNIQLWSCNSSNVQYFFFDGRRIKMQAAPDKCLGPDPDSPAGTAPNVILATCSTQNLQEWYYDGFSKAFRSATNTNYCLDVDHSGTANGTNIQLFECNGTGAQQFEVQ